MDGCWRQFHTNKNLQFGVRWRRKLYSVRTTQLRYSTAVRTAWLWNSSGVLQLHYEGARLWNCMAVRWPWSEVAPLFLDSCALLCAMPVWSAVLCCALLCLTLVCSAFLWQDIFGVLSLVFQFQLGKCSLQSCVEKESVLFKTEGSWLIWTEVPAPDPWLLCLHAKTPNAPVW